MNDCIIILLVYPSFTAPGTGKAYLILVLAGFIQPPGGTSARPFSTDYP
jgi:hypothetical protein